MAREYAWILGAGLRSIVAGIRGRAIIVASLSAMTTSCSEPQKVAEADECLNWRSVRYCFPKENVLGIGKTEAQGSAALRIPLDTESLRRCNARSTAIDRVAYDYDNVDVGLTSLAGRVTPAQIYNQQLAFYLDARAPSLASAGKARCWANRPGTIKVRTCLEREGGDGQTYVTTCMAPGGVGNPACSDLTVSGGFVVEINSDIACYPLRASMRRHVKQYLDAHRSENHG